MSDEKEWIDFKAIKAKVEVKPVLEHFGILEYLEQRKDELVGWCPFGKEHGKEDSFCFNVEKRSFQCFACKARGSVLDFIAKYTETDLRGAAKIVLEILGEDGASASREEKPSGAKGRPYGKPAETPVAEAKKPEVRPEPKREKRGAPAEQECLPFYTLGHAQFLVEAGLLDSARLVVVAVDSLETFLAVTAKQLEDLDAKTVRNAQN